MKRLNKFSKYNYNGNNIKSFRNFVSEDVDISNTYLSGSTKTKSNTPFGGTEFTTGDKWKVQVTGGYIKLPEEVINTISKITGDSSEKIQRQFQGRGPYTDGIGSFNRTHFPSGIPEEYRGLGLGYLIYEAYVKELGFASSRSNASSAATRVWSKIAGDPDFYGISIPNGIYVIWKEILKRDENELLLRLYQEIEDHLEYFLPSDIIRVDSEKILDLVDEGTPEALESLVKLVKENLVDDEAFNIDYELFYDSPEITRLFFKYFENNFANFKNIFEKTLEDKGLDAMFDEYDKMLDKYKTSDIILKKIEESARKVIEYELRNLYRKVENAVGWRGNYSRNGLKAAKDLYNNEIRIKEKAIFDKFGEIDMKEYNISKYFNRIQNTLFSESLRDVFRKNESYQEAKDFYDKNIKPNINNDKVNLRCFFYLLRNDRDEDFSQVFDRIGDFKDVIFKTAQDYFENQLAIYLYYSKFKKYKDYKSKFIYAIQKDGLQKAKQMYQNETKSLIQALEIDIDFYEDYSWCQNIITKIFKKDTKIKLSAEGHFEFLFEIYEVMEKEKSEKMKKNAYKKFSTDLATAFNNGGYAAAKEFYDTQIESKSDMLDVEVFDSISYGTDLPTRTNLKMLAKEHLIKRLEVYKQVEDETIKRKEAQKTKIKKVQEPVKKVQEPVVQVEVPKEKSVNVNTEIEKPKEVPRPKRTFLQRFADFLFNV